MRFSNLAMAASVASATPMDVTPVQERTLLGLDLDNLISNPISANVNLDTDLSGLTLVEGVAVDANLNPLAEVAVGEELAVRCTECWTRGDINATVSLQNLIPALTLTLTDIRAYLDLDVHLGLGTYIAVNLFTPQDPLSLSLSGLLNVDAMVYLDLVLGAETEIDVSAGVYVSLVEDAIIETNILNGELLKTAVDGVAVQVLPVEVRIGCTQVLASLRLRVELAAKAEVDLGDVLGLDIPDIGAGVEVGVYANLMEYVALFCDTPSCPVSRDHFGVNVGVGIGLDVEVEDILTAALAPTVSIELLEMPTSSYCEHGPHPTITKTAQTSSTLATQTASITEKPTSGMVTSTLTGSTTYHVTSCAAHVANCPSGSDVTVVHTTHYTTVCPATASLTGSTTSGPVTATTSHSSADLTTVTTHMTTLVPCSHTETYSGVPTISATATGSSPAQVTTSATTSETSPVAGETTAETSPVSETTAETSPAVATETSPVAQSSGYSYGGQPKPSAQESTSYPVAGQTTAETSPAVATETSAGAESTGYAAQPSTIAITTSVGKSTISTYYSTSTRTISSCHPSDSGCNVGDVTSEISQYTTICPVTESEGVSPSTPAGGVPTAATTAPGSGSGSSETYGGSVPSMTGPAPGAVTETYPAGSGSGSSETVPAGSAVTETYPASSLSETVPAGGAATETYPASSPSETVPAGGAGGYPSGAPSSYPVAGSSTAAVTTSYPVSSVIPVPSAPTTSVYYPNYPIPSNSTATMTSVSKPASEGIPGSYPTSSSPAGASPSTTAPVTAGASKVGSGVAGLLAVVAAMVVMQ